MAARRSKDWGIKVDPLSGECRLDFRVGRGERAVRVRGPAFTTDRVQARALRDREFARAWATAVREAPAVTWNEASIEWLHHQESKGSRSLEDMRDKLRWFEPHLGKLVLEHIDSSAVSTVLGRKRAEGRKLPHGRRRPLKSATLNRYYAVIASVFHFAIRKGWASHCPQFVESVSEPHGEAREVLWLRPEQWERLRPELPEHLRQMARFALATGLRASNVTGLEWSRIDLARRIAWIPPTGSKSKRALQVPLNSEALSVLAEQQGKHARYVFTYQGRPISEPAGAAWAKAKKRAGITQAFRWHDLRHTWATWHCMSGTKLEALMALGGWHSYEMVLTYAHQAEGYLAQVAENVTKSTRRGQESTFPPVAVAQQSMRAVDVLAGAS